MLMTDIIQKKKQGLSLTKEEIDFWIKNYTKNEIPDYQVSSLLMAICLKGMNEEETSNLTNAMLYSGDVIDLSEIEGVKIDKHSTGGVGDKTSLVLGPLVASCGVKVAKMSGRGLGHTGGTLDKLESIKGVTISIEKERFIEQVNDIGIAIIGQTGNLVPADKKLYALRDVTSTVDSIPLISSSIMSKKLASGSDTILLDVKFGSGAFMKSVDDAKKLATAMVKIGKSFNKDTRAVITDMNQPLGNAIGNSLEVIEAIEPLIGNGPKDLDELCLTLGSIILLQAKVETDIDSARELLKTKISNGKALNKLYQMIEAQGGNVQELLDYSCFKKAKYEIEIYSDKEGFIEEITALQIGECAMHLGAGRKTKDDIIDMSAGILLNKKVGDYVQKGEKICTIFTDLDDIKNIILDIKSAFVLNKDYSNLRPLIYDIID